ncbi:hypothetical protein Pelo_15471 [Pelomyxa schiedti]|nr:hypothetical protein Pelo_15471 [Pelomyxa schiedti]
MYVFGGNSGPSNTLWQFTFSNSSWEQIDTPNTPPQHQFHTSVLVGNLLYVLLASHRTPSPSYFSLDLDTLAWTTLSPPPITNLLRGAASTSFGSGTIFHGGRFKSRISDEVWHHSSGEWSQIVPEGLTIPLYFHTLVPWAGDVWIFGGVGLNGNTNHLLQLTCIKSAIKPLYDDFADIPDHCLLNILSFLPDIDLGRSCRVSIRFRRLASSEELWKSHCTRIFGDSTLLEQYYSKSAVMHSQHQRDKFWKDAYYYLKGKDPSLCDSVFLYKDKQWLASKIPAADDLFVAVLGSGGVGKSSLTSTYMVSYESTADSPLGKWYRKCVLIQDYPVWFNVLDPGSNALVSSCNETRTATSKGIGLVHGFILMYSVADMESFCSVSRILGEIAKMRGLVGIPYGFSWPAIVICANKMDSPHAAHAVPDQKGKSLALSFGCPFVETNALSSDSAAALFEIVALETTKNAVGRPPSPQAKCHIM